MFNKFKFFIKNLLPPLFYNFLLKFFSRSITFAGPYKSWDIACSSSRGYDEPKILENVFNTTSKLKNGEISGERDSVELEKPYFSWPIISTLLWVASKNNNKLNVLDYGGSLGSTYFQSKYFLTSIESLSWSVVEQKNFVDLGKQYFEDKCLNFEYSIEEYFNKGMPDVVIFGSVLQYLENPEEIISYIVSKHKPVILVAGTPFSDDTKERIFIQKVPASIYEATYPMKALNEESVIPTNYKKIADMSDSMGIIKVGKASFTWRGFILIPDQI